MKYRVIVLLILIFQAAAAWNASAQNMDPTVEVSRNYQARHIDVMKPQMQMAVPDSVLHFDIDVDYTVNSSPYKGAYEFRPYYLDIRPEETAADVRNLYLRLGAGYSMHPVVDLVYTPALNSRAFSMSIYGTHRSYFGRYRSISILPDTGSGAELGWDRDSRPRYSGYDTYTRAGVDGHVLWKTGSFSFDLGYLGYAGKDTLQRRGYDAFTADFRIASNRNDDRYFYYNANVRYSYWEDKTHTDGMYFLSGHDFSAYASLGPVFSEHSRALMDIAAEVSDYGTALSSSSGRFSLTPHYIIYKGRWFLDLGAELSVLLGNDRSSSGQVLLGGNQVSVSLPDGISPGKMHSSKGQYIYPDIEIGFEAVKNYLDIYVKADGGENINRYSDLIKRNRFTGLGYSHSAIGLPVMDNTVERINARLGFKGNVGSRLVYDINAGYARYRNLLLDAVVINTPGISESLPAYGRGIYTYPSPMLPAMSYGNCNLFYAEMDFRWHSQDIAADARFSYKRTDLVRTGTAGFVPSPFTADIDVVYNWKKRIYVGLHCNAALSRDGYAMALSRNDGADATGISASLQPVRLPGFTDLGVSAEYWFTRKSSFWVYGGNLLNMTIQRSPLYAESGVYLTAGISVSL